MIERRRRGKLTRSEAAKVAANTRWAHEADRSKATRPGTDGFLRKFEDLVDPNRTLPPDERAKRAKNALSAHMIKLRARRRR